MVDVSTLATFIDVVVFGICLCVGYIIKNFIPNDKANKFIPLIVGVLGVVISAWAKHAFTPEVVLIGLFSGLASTGAYELFRNLINQKGE